MKSWTVRCRMDGNPTQFDPMTEDEAKRFLDDVRRAVDPGAVLVDLLAELAARLPASSRVRHTGTGDLGTVADQDAHAVNFRGRGDVQVRLDRFAYMSWFVADCFELAPAS